MPSRNRNRGKKNDGASKDKPKDAGDQKPPQASKINEATPTTSTTTTTTGGVRSTKGFSQKKAVFPSIKGLSERNGDGSIGNIMPTSDTSFIVFLDRDDEDDDDHSVPTARHVFEFTFDEEAGDWMKSKDPFEVPKEMYADGNFSVPLHSSEADSYKYLCYQKSSLGVFDTKTMRFEREIIGPNAKYGNTISYHPSNTQGDGRIALCRNDGALFDLLTGDCLQTLQYGITHWINPKNHEERIALEEPVIQNGGDTIRFCAMLPDGRIVAFFQKYSWSVELEEKGTQGKKVNLSPMLVLFSPDGKTVIHQQPAPKSDFGFPSVAFTLPNGKIMIPGPKSNSVFELSYEDGRGFFLGPQLAQLRVLPCFSHIAIFPNGTVLFAENRIAKFCTQFEFHDVGLTKEDMAKYCVPVKAVPPQISIRKDETDYDDNHAQRAKIAATDRASVLEIPAFPTDLPSKLSLGVRFAENCINLKTVDLNIGPQLFKIQQGAFYNCPSLESVVLHLGEQFKRIGASFCCNLPSLEKLELNLHPAATLELGANFANDCPKLTRFVLPPTSQINQCFLYGCTGLQEIDASAPCPELKTVHGALAECSALTKVDLTGWSQIEKAANLFYNSLIAQGATISYPSSGALAGASSAPPVVLQKARCPLDFRKGLIFSGNREYKVSVDGKVSHSRGSAGFMGAEGTSLNGTWALDSAKPDWLLAHFTASESFIDYDHEYESHTEVVNTKRKLRAMTSSRVA